MAEDDNNTPLHTKVGENELFKPVSAILIIFSFISLVLILPLLGLSKNRKTIRTF